VFVFRHYRNDYVDVDDTDAGAMNHSTDECVPMWLSQSIEYWRAKQECQNRNGKRLT